MRRHHDESLLELARWTLGAVAGCAALLWCRLVGHGPLLPCNEGAAEVCVRCGDWWLLDKDVKQRARERFKEET